jgi:hypothetical protein
MYFCSKMLLLFACLLANSVFAQQSFSIELPDVEIRANRIVRGDGDTYGLGTWKSTFTVSLEGSRLKVDGQISFVEKANDFTTIVGEYHQRIPVGALEGCRHCDVSLDETHGSVSGPNIGARGYRWFNGQGLVRRARIQTDVVGDDPGKIGGTIQFVPIRILVDCSVVNN